MTAPQAFAHGHWKQLSITFDTALARLPEVLKAEGFGVITEIDMQATLKAKIGVDFRRYRIFGACNPKLAHGALLQDLHVGVLLPCNVVLYETDAGKTMVGAIDPVQTLGAGGQVPALTEVARDVGERLDRVLAAMATPVP